jgi:hypothetical protein
VSPHDEALLLETVDGAGHRRCRHPLAHGEGRDRAAAVHAQVGEHRQLRIAHRVGGTGAAQATGQPESGHAKVCGGEVE